MQRHGDRTAGASGFTLVELLMVVIIMAIAAAMIIPYSTSSATTAMSAARMVTSDLQHAQNVAVTMQTPVTVTFNIIDNEYSLTSQSGPLIHPITKKAYTVQLANQRGMSAASLVSTTLGSTGSVTFDEFGSPSSAGSIIIQAGSVRYRLEVAAATGNIKVVAL